MCIRDSVSAGSYQAASADLFDIVKGQLLDEGLSEEEIKDIMLTLTPDEILKEIEESSMSGGEGDDRHMGTDDVARTWINKLPGGATFTAEREAYISILKNMNFSYQFGGERKFELEAVSDNEFNDWIGAQIRIDMYGWVLPGNPTKAAELARNDAMLSHRGCAVECSAFIAALAAVIPNSETRMSAVKTAMKYIDNKSDACEAIEVGISNVGKSPDEIIKKYNNPSEFQYCSIGGDGSLNALVNSLMKNNITMPEVSCLPGGSGSDFIRTFALPQNIEEAVEHLIVDNFYEVDVGLIKNKTDAKYFINVLNIGFLASTVEVSEKFPNLFRAFRYPLSFCLLYTSPSPRD